MEAIFFVVVEKLFELGACVITPAAEKKLASIQIEPIELLTRHVSGDWAEMDEEDQALNKDAIANGDRILSVYTFENDVKFYVITEWDRSVTTILLPSEY